MKSLPNYAGPGGAKEFAEDLIKELAKKSQTIMLSPGQANDALAAIEHLSAFQLATGHKISLLTAASEYCQFKRKIGDRSPSEVADGYLNNVPTVKREDLSKAVEEFISGEQPRTRSHSGQRAQIAEKYQYIRAHYLRQFASAFSGYAVCDLGKHNLDGFFGSELLAKMSPKSRNHHRTAIAQFLAWCVRKDYLASNHQLLEADRMRREETNGAEIQFYTPREFRDLLINADDTLRPIIAIGGLAGLRVQEILRLDWADVRRVKGHIEVAAGKSKTRSRRLVQICPSLANWLAPFRSKQSGSLWNDTESMFQKSFSDLAKKAKVTRKKNGLHHSFCSFAYVKNGEIWTTQRAGHAPAMLHGSYKGLLLFRGRVLQLVIRIQGNDPGIGHQFLPVLVADHVVKARITPEVEAE